jgi:hypothetical protein
MAEYNTNLNEFGPKGKQGAFSRLEGRPRTRDFTRALRTETYDGLWFLARQWQMGELHAEDAGSAIQVRMKLKTASFSRFSPGDNGAVLPFDNTVPLETQVEAEDIDFDLRTHLQITEAWKQLLLDPGLVEAFRREYAYTYVEPDPEDNIGIANQAADKASTRLRRFARGKVIDGKRLLADARNESFPVSLGLPANIYDEDGAAKRLVKWFDQLYHQPDPAVSEQSSPSWDPSRLEYRFAVSVPEEEDQRTKLTAGEYYHGRLDWYAFDIDENGQLSDPGDVAEEAANHIRERSITVIPGEIRPAGFPNKRWWALEDGSINPAAINGGAADVARVLLFEFALLYSNDWFIVPLKVPAGSLSTVEEIIVDDVFNRRTLVRPANHGLDEGWEHWSMYNLSKQEETHSANFDNRLLVPPVVPAVLEGKPLEIVELLRDEMANLVYGIETVLPDAMGLGKDSRTNYQEFRRALQEQYAGEDTADSLQDAEFYYQMAVNNVPEYWIPFTPVKLAGSNHNIMLQRGYFRRNIPGVPNREPVRPKSRILSEEKGAFKIHEEEAPRAGAHVSRSFQLARWYDGKSFLWLGRRKRIGRGEGQSGLRFDVLKKKEDTDITGDNSDLE